MRLTSPTKKEQIHKLSKDEPLNDIRNNLTDIKHWYEIYELLKTGDLEEIKKADKNGVDFNIKLRDDRQRLAPLFVDGLTNKKGVYKWVRKHFSDEVVCYATGYVCPLLELAMIASNTHLEAKYAPVFDYFLSHIDTAPLFYLNWVANGKKISAPCECEGLLSFPCEKILSPKMKEIFQKAEEKRKENIALKHTLGSLFYTVCDSDISRADADAMQKTPNFGKTWDSFSCLSDDLIKEIRGRLGYQDGTHDGVIDHYYDMWEEIARKKLDKIIEDKKGKGPKGKPNRFDAYRHKNSLAR